MHSFSKMNTSKRFVVTSSISTIDEP
jgi:hypothetical protein